MRLPILLFVFALSSFGAWSAGSSSSYKSLNKAERTYNQGVELMKDKQFLDAEKKFRAALKRDKNWAQAHNNLAYTLRKQGADHYNTALFHYNKAISIAPSLPEPYMYRGVLHVQMGNPSLANDDLAKLRALKSQLADELEFVIENGEEKAPEQFFGVFEKVKG
ncbi:tetratricopeptide repeat protein [Vibrio sp. DNB22_10_4]